MSAGAPVLARQATWSLDIEESGISSTKEKSPGNPFGGRAGLLGVWHYMPGLIESLLGL